MSGMQYETYINRVRDIALDHAVNRQLVEHAEAERIHAARLTYGVGQPGRRGVCIYDTWKTKEGKVVDLIEVCAMGQESLVQLAGTTMHELGHVLARFEHAHDKVWKERCQHLGFQTKLRVGGAYHMAMFAPEIRRQVYQLMLEFFDGEPDWKLIGLTIPKNPRICSAGIGSKGGKSQGKGSGSRLRLYECACKPKPVKVRVASDDFLATCGRCSFPFMMPDEWEDGER